MSYSRAAAFNGKSGIPTGVAVDSQGNAYVTGYSYSQDFPVTKGALQTRTLGYTTNAFLAKISPQGDRLLFSTYLGGSDGDAANAIAVDSSGNVYLTGFATSFNFPITAGAAQNRIRQGCPTPPPPRWQSRFRFGDAFAVKMNADSGQLVYSTFLGGACGEHGFGITVDPFGNAYVVGVTASPDFPVSSGAPQTRFGDGPFLGFLVRLSPQGSVVQSTLLGGTREATAKAVTLDAHGDVYVTGASSGFDRIQFGLPGPALSIRRDTGSDQDSVGFPFSSSGAAYLLKLDANTLARRYLKYLGGSFGEGTAIVVDSANRAWITGTNDNFLQNPADLRFPLVHPFQAKLGSGFVSQLSPDGSSLLFSSKADTANALSLDASGNAFVAGSTRTSDFYKYFNETVLLLRIDTDMPSSVTVEEPQMLVPQVDTPFPFDGITAGELLVLTGSGLGPEEEVTAKLTAGRRLPIILADTKVTLDGIPAPLLSVQTGRIVCIAPFSIGQRANTSVLQISNGSTDSNTIRLGVVSTAVSIIAAVNSDGQVNSPDHPASPGSLVTIYATGFGQTEPPSIDGEISAAGPRQFEVEPIRVIVNEVDAEIIYLGAAPGQVSSITQINVRVPLQLTPGRYKAQVGWGKPFLQDSSAISLAVGVN